MAKFVLALIIKHLLIACPFLTLMFHQLINCYFTLQVSDEAKYNHQYLTEPGNWRSFMLGWVRIPLWKLLTRKHLKMRYKIAR